MKSVFPGYYSLLIWFTCLLLVSTITIAQDDRDDINLVYASEIRSSPFDPPDEDSFVTDDGPGLDTGCTFDTDPEHPLTIDILIDRSVGPVDANGFLVDPDPLIAKGIIPSTVQISMPAFDIDIFGSAPPESDAVAFNGENLGFLTGDDGVWQLNTFSVPISKVKFPVPPASGATAVPQANRVIVTVDTLSSGSWCAAIDWVALIIPIKPKIALTLKPKASNNNQILENSGSGLIDTIYQQSADADCNITEDIGAIDEYPFSGSSEAALFASSNETKVETKIEPCPVGSLPLSPEVIVKWSVNGTSLSGTETWSGLEGDVTMAMPGTVGAYNVTFEYTVDDEILPAVTRKLFVTKKPPLVVGTVGIPRLSWYEHATSWASGKSSETDIFESLLQGLYSYGQANWRYGYNFTPGLPKCNWEQLTADPIACDYADCYVYSDVFENMAKTLGVGGLMFSRVTGAGSGEFITTGSPSLDPLFTGSARPFSSSTYDRYRFSSHSLRKYGSTYYDATFNGVYSSDTAFIAWNLDGNYGFDANGLFDKTIEGAKIYPEIAVNSYDSWPANKYKPPGSPIISEAAVMTLTSSDVEITGLVTFIPLDENNDDIYEALVSNVEINIITPGTYLVRGVLKKNGTVISNQPSFDIMKTTQVTVGDQPGLYGVELRFSGEQIYLSSEDGPYTLEVLAFAAGGSPATKELTTPSYNHTKFGERSGRILVATDSVLDTDNDSRHDFLVVDVDTNILNAGTYMLQGTLLKDGNTVVNASASFMLGAGQQTVALQFPGVAIFRSGQDGPYEAVISLLNLSGERQDDIELITQFYDHTQFEGILDITGAFSDQGIDTNANSLFDVLRVDFGVDVREAGTYQVTAALGNLVDANKVYSDAVMNLAFGAQSMTLNFSGPEINSQQMDGPYTIEISLRDPTTNELLDKVAIVQQTAAYSHLDFEPLGSVNSIILTGNSSDEGVDNNANGLFDLLKVSVELKLETADTYTWSARLVDSDGTELGFDSRSSFLNAGTASIDFFFDGQAIGQNGVAGPYQVKGLLISGQGGANLVSSQVATTQAYGADEFEGFVAQQEGDLDGDGDVDRNDLKLIQAARNTPASGSSDPLDLDGDGMITGLDARKLILLCTRPRCAT